MDEMVVVSEKLKYDRLINCLIRDGGLRVSNHNRQISWVDAGQRYFIISNRSFRDICRTMRNRADEVIRLDTWDLPGPLYTGMMTRCQQLEHGLTLCCLRNLSVSDSFISRSGSDFFITHVRLKVI